MKRSQIQRRKELRARKRLQSRKGLRRSSLKRTGSINRRGGTLKRQTRLRSKPQPTTGVRLWIRNMPCVVPGCRRKPIDPHHVKAKGMGKRDPHAMDRANLVPLCRYHHQLGDSPGWSWDRFEQEFQVDLSRHAEELGILWRVTPGRAMWEDLAVAINEERGVPYRRAV